jgi:2-polyprenyl-6-methoxyphenol hydroxylase-like FAD-dependent oxidoreductase
MFDVIVVGARCAGSATAMLLARRGVRVLLLDRATFPSDNPASTHMVWQAGSTKLRDWGLLESLMATGCPGQRDSLLDLGDFVLKGRAPAAGFGNAAYAPRRIVLDGMLVEAALAAGAELRENVSVSEVLNEGDHVSGVRYRSRTGDPIDVRARLVIGADGTNSRFARAVGAQTEALRPRLQRTFFSYFADLPLTAMEFYARPGRMIFAWRTNDDLTVAGICCRVDQSAHLRADLETGFYRELDALTPEFGQRMRASRRAASWLGGSTRNFYRTAAGPGWALVGDAGLTMDPITAAGITNAFRDAEFLADAVAQGLSGTGGLDLALAGYERRRNEASLPLLEFTCEMAKLDPPPAEVIRLFEALRDDQAATDDYFGVFAQTVPVTRFFAPENLARIIAGGQAGPASGPVRVVAGA